MSRRKVPETVPEEISEFYYWVCENAGVPEANDFLDLYMLFKEDTAALSPQPQLKQAEGTPAKRGENTSE